jgi:hypothetical protein
MTYTKLITVALLLSTALEGQAVEWSSIVKKNDYEVLVDIDSYNVTQGYPFILSKTIYTKAQNRQNGTSAIHYQYQLKNTQFNCKQALFKVTSMGFYTGQNKVLLKEKPRTNFQVITPNSDESAVGQLVCQVHQMLGGQ